MMHRRAFLHVGAPALLLSAALACSPSNSGSPPAPGSGSGGTGGTSGGAGGSPNPSPTGVGATGFGGGFIGVETDSGSGNCAQQSFVSDLLPTNMLLVVDRSGSMNCLPSTPTAECEGAPPTSPLPGSKWEAITGALDASLTQLAQIPDTSVGLSFFSNDDICGTNSMPNVGVNPLTQPQLDALRASLAAVEPGGGTPIVGSVIQAYKHLHQQAQAPGNRFVVLVTDGSDSCFSRYEDYGVTYPDVQAQLFDVEMPKAATQNIRTFVIGAPGSEGARAFLSRMAKAGNTARSETCTATSASDDVGDCHFDMTTSANFAADFAAALNEITGRAALTCEFAVPDGSRADPARTNVSYFRGGEQEVELFRDDTLPCDGGAEGWQFIENDTKIILCGSVCDEVRADNQSRVDIVLGCETRLVH
jgi:hypothetical protein